MSEPASLVHVSSRRSEIVYALLRRPFRALCGYRLDGTEDEPAFTLAGVCRDCATRAGWTEAEIARADAIHGGSR